MLIDFPAHSCLRVESHLIMGPFGYGHSVVVLNIQIPPTRCLPPK